MLMHRIDEFKNTKLPVVEIFQSISGEGISAGYIVTFVRIGGCNLRCSYCDTVYSHEEASCANLWLTPEEIYERVAALGCRDILCTGGEPLELNKAKRYLPLFLASKGLRVRIETNGSCPVYSDEEIRAFCGALFPELYYVLDVKCPSSGFHKSTIFEENYVSLRKGDEIKFVVGHKDDIEYSFDIIDRYKDIFSSKKVVINFSTVFNKMEPAELVEILKEKQRYFTQNNLKVRLSLQLHKFIWNPELRGV
jgi:7-carboxy-7-deazaguanine synthase